ncbi:MAG: HRDC domain-containing protein [Bdellovibrionia bacterium]
MKNHLELLSTPEQILEMAQVLKTHSMIAFDTEFIRESTFYPIVEIIQVATDSESWLVDAQAFKKNHRERGVQAYDPGLQPLLDVFSDPKILKILHAAQGDQECLYSAFGIVASPTLDTAIAASLCGHGDGIGLGRLVKLVLDVTLQKGHARTNWSVRPLPKQLMEYAHSDVVYLVELGQKLLDHLEQLGRKTWAFELSAKWENKALYQSDVDGLTQKLARGGRLDRKTLVALRSLVQWREDRVRQLNLPRRWVADDHVLIDLAQVRPKDLEHLSTFRGLNKGELKNSGEAILKALFEGIEEEGLVLNKPSKPPVPSQEESQVLELLGCFINILADKHKIAAKHLMATAKLLPLLRSKIATPEELIKAGILSEEAARLIGNELIETLNGKRALWIKDNRIQILKMEKQEKLEKPESPK